ncbi:MAG: Fic family protein [Clostridia bacterium]|nr:Fic family protein [Clostridia bacterium]
MKLESYKAGKYVRIEDYSAFIISGINYNWEWEDTALNKLSAEASRMIGELNSYSKLIPNVDTYIKMLMKIEANKSNKIEGANTSLEEDLLDESNIEPEKKADWENAKRYLDATKYAIENVKEGSGVSKKLLKDIHKMLMQVDDSEAKYVGKFRMSQNFVGGDTPESAEYIPPPYTEISDCMADFERFIENQRTDTPDVVKSAMLHYQFETIHPFIGGNRKNWKNDYSTLFPK